MMKFSIVILGLVLLSCCTAIPKASPDEPGFRETLLNTVKDKATEAFSSALDCQTAGCLPPLYYCHTGLKSHCRYTPLTWFLMIGLPLIAIGIVATIWYYKIKDQP